MAGAQGSGVAGHRGLAQLPWEPAPGLGLPLHLQQHMLLSQVTHQALNAVPASVPGLGLARSPALTWCALGKGWDKGRKECPFLMEGAGGKPHSEGQNVGKWAREKGATSKPLCLGSLTHSFAQS